MEIKNYQASDLLLLRRNVMRPGMESFNDVIYKTTAILFTVN